MINPNTCQKRDSSCIPCLNLVHCYDNEDIECAFDCENRWKWGLDLSVSWYIVNPPLSAFEEKDGNLSKVEINEMSRLMGNIRPKIPSDNTMPCWVVFFVKLFFDVGCNIFFNVIFFECLRCTVNCVLLHFFGHIRIFNNCLSIRHFCALYSDYF